MKKLDNRDISTNISLIRDFKISRKVDSYSNCEFLYVKEKLSIVRIASRFMIKGIILEHLRKYITR